MSANLIDLDCFASFVDIITDGIDGSGRIARKYDISYLHPIVKSI